uniref:DUF4760 domain-containing protein n=1 Tax=viral metagenome TaxID=1070528 RepID=A0A6C0BLP1_9ZZZZ
MFHHFDLSYRYLDYICLTALILLGIFTYLYWSVDVQIMSRVSSYIQVVTVFLLLTTSLITVMNFKYQLDDRRRTFSLQYANLTQNETNDIDKLFMNNPQLDRLYFEMYSHLPQIQEIQKLKQLPQVTPDMLKLEHHMASIIFQKIADIYFCEQLDHNEIEDSVEWIYTFRCWMRSPILLSHWKQLKYEHHPDVRRFVEQVLIDPKKLHLVAA